MLSVIILGAGKGKRMKSKTPKVLAPIAGKRLIDYPIAVAKEIKADNIIAVLGDGGKEVEEYIKPYKLKIAYQKEQLGTADAVKSAMKLIKDSDDVLITAGDMPLLNADEIKKFIKSADKKSVNFISTKLKNPFGYGRVIRGMDNRVIGIREEKDCNEHEKKIDEVNTGIYYLKGSILKERLNKVKNSNAQKEFYLTDIVDNNANAYLSKEHEAYLGVNDKVQLTIASKMVYRNRLEEYMKDGVIIVNHYDTYIDPDVKIGADTIINPNVHIRGKSVIGSGVVIDSGVIIENSEIADDVTIKAYSVIEGAEVGKGSVIGPMAHLRAGSILKGDNKIGNFVELKKAEFGEGSKASHLSYIGDAFVGSNVNIGCGTITCNYDGYNKHITKIGDNVFVGSDVQFVAPVTIGAGAIIGAGSTIVEDVERDALALSRSEQKSIKGKAKLINERNRSRKGKKK